MENLNNTTTDGLFDLEDLVEQSNITTTTDTISLDSANKLSEVLRYFMVSNAPKYNIPQQDIDYLLEGYFTSQEDIDHASLVRQNLSENDELLNATVKHYIYQTLGNSAYIYQQIKDKYDELITTYKKILGDIQLETAKCRTRLGKLSSSSLPYDSNNTYILNSSSQRELQNKINMQRIELEQQWITQSYSARLTQQFMQAFVELYKLVAVEMRDGNGNNIVPYYVQYKLKNTSLMTNLNFKELTGETLERDDAMNGITVSKTGFECSCGYCDNRNVGLQVNLPYIDYSTTNIVIDYEEIIKELWEMLEALPAFVNDSIMEIYETALIRNIHPCTPQILKLNEEYKEVLMNTPSDKEKLAEIKRKKVELIKENSKGVNLSQEDKKKGVQLTYMKKQLQNKHRELLDMLILPDTTITDKEAVPFNKLKYSIKFLLNYAHPLLKNGEDYINSSHSEDYLKSVADNQIARTDFVFKNMFSSLDLPIKNCTLSPKNDLCLKLPLFTCKHCGRVLLVPEPILETIMYWKNKRTKFSDYKGAMQTFEEVLTPIRAPKSEKERIEIKVKNTDKVDNFFTRQLGSKLTMEEAVKQRYQTAKRDAKTNLDDTRYTGNAQLQFVKMKHNFCNDILAQRYVEASNADDYDEMQKILQENNDERQKANIITPNLGKGNLAGTLQFEMEQQARKQAQEQESQPKTKIISRDYKFSTEVDLKQQQKEQKLAEYGDVDLDELSYEELTETGFYTYENLIEYYGINPAEYDAVDEIVRFVISDTDDYETLPKALKEAGELNFEDIPHDEWEDYGF